MAHVAFISMAREDASIGEELCAALESNGIRCWMAPRDVSPGSYSEAILTAIEGSAVVLLLISTSANESDHVVREVDLALSAGISILPIRIEDVPPGRKLKYYVQSLHWFDAFESPLERQIPRLVNSVRACIAEGREIPEVQQAPGSEIANALAAARPIDDASDDVSNAVNTELKKYGSVGVGMTNLLIFSTAKQKTWLSFTGAGIFCVLDNRLKGGRIHVQWREPLEGLNENSISAVDRAGRPGVLRVRSHRNWLYTRALFGSGEKLKKKILREIVRLQRSGAPDVTDQRNAEEAQKEIGTAIYAVVRRSGIGWATTTIADLEAVISSHHRNDIARTLTLLADKKLLLLGMWDRFGAFHMYPCALTREEFFYRGSFQVQGTKEGDRAFNESQKGK